MHHIPVLKKEILALLDSHTIHSVFDGTCGGGGHALALLTAHPEITTYYGCDQDPDAIEHAKKATIPFAHKMIWCHQNFADAFPTDQVDLALLDIGISSMQLDTDERGFSFQRTGPLDMRMNQHSPYTAADLINTESEETIADIIWKYGEERRSRTIAKAIVEQRKKARFITTDDLSRCVESVVSRHGKTHPATCVFQALRIAVNDELGVLERAIPAIASRIAPGGLFCIISFHSLEDRIVKHGFQKLVKDGDFSFAIKKCLPASREEILENRRSRSAKLRAIFRKE